jgi:hypothetical protein
VERHRSCLTLLDPMGNYLFFVRLLVVFLCGLHGRNLAPSPHDFFLTYTFYLFSELCIQNPIVRVKSFYLFHYIGWLIMGVKSLILSYLGLQI